MTRLTIALLTIAAGAALTAAALRHILSRDLAIGSLPDAYPYLIGDLT